MSYGDWSSDVCSSDLLPAYQDYTIRAKMSEVILAMSSCRTSITEVYQSGPTNAPAVNGWGCEILTASQMTKYVNQVTTTIDGAVKEIGRASCRERVQVWVVPVAL